jgi:hypothetical protein
MIYIRYFEPSICTHKSTNQKSGFQHFNLQASIEKAAGRDGWIKALIIRSSLANLQAREEGRTSEDCMGEGYVDYVSTVDDWMTTTVLECGRDGMIHDEATRASARRREIITSNHNTRSAFNLNRVSTILAKMKTGTRASLQMAQGMFTRDLQKIV